MNESAVTSERRIFGGLSLISLAQLSGRAFSLLTLPILSRMLSPEDYGVAAVTMSTVQVGSILALLGIDLSYYRLFLQEDSDKRLLFEHFCWRAASLGSLISAAVFSVFWVLFGRAFLEEQNAIVAFFSFGLIPLTAIVSMASVRARLSSRYGRLAISELTLPIVSTTTSLLIAQFLSATHWALLVGMSAGSIGTLLVLGMPRTLSILKRSKLDFTTKKEAFFLGVAGAVIAPMYWALTSLDRWFILAIESDSSLGIYTMTATIGTMGVILVGSINATWLPEACKLFAADRELAKVSIGHLWSKLLVIHAFGWLIISALGGDVIRGLTDAKFHGATDLIPILATGIFFYGMASLNHASFLLVSGINPAAFSWVAGTGISLLLNAVLIPIWSLQGAAFTQAISFAFIAALTLMISRRNLALVVPWSRLIGCFALLAATGFVSSTSWAHLPVISGLLKAIPLVFSMLVATFILDPGWIKSLIWRTHAKPQD